MKSLYELAKQNIVYQTTSTFNELMQSNTICKRCGSNRKISIKHHINPYSKLWEYSIKCLDCGNTISNHKY